MSPIRISILLAAVAAGLTVTATHAAQRRGAPTAPEAFTSAVQAKTSSAASATRLDIQIDRYTLESDRKTMTDALTFGGYSAFVQALRKAPAVGHVAIGGQKFPLKWAREQPTEKGRAISLVTDSPVYFIGGGQVDAKPREGFQLAVVQLTVDESGLGTGSMAAAAKVKLDPQGSVVIEDYAEEPIKLTYVHRVIS